MAKGHPRPIGDVLAQLMARRGYARVQSGDACARAWRELAGDDLASCSRATQVRRGVLEVVVSNSLMIQELGFRKSDLLRQLAERLPDEEIRELRFRVGRIS